MAEGFQFRVPALESPLRLDLFLIRHFPGSGRKYWREALSGTAKINGRRAAKGQTVQGGEEIWLPEEPQIDAPIEANAKLTLEILHEDESLFAIHKPAGQPSHPLQAKEKGTAVNAVLARFPDQAKLKPAREAGLVHRLDNETSGVLLFAKTTE
ncbi:MAG TPA: pseudouridine synthase, partial [bacterium]|nr:pseudouridine synthase [bacterium]